MKADELKDSKNNLESLKETFKEEFESFLESSEDDNEIDLEQVSNMVSEGYTSGEGWSIEIEEDENDEDIRNQEVARLVADGFTSGYYPTWSIEIDQPTNNRELAEQKFEDAKETLDKAIEIVNDLSDDTDLFPEGLSGLPDDLRWESDLEYILAQFDKLSDELEGFISNAEKKEEFIDYIEDFMNELENEIDSLSFDDEQECIYTQELTSVLDKFKEFLAKSEFDTSDIDSAYEVLVSLVDDEESQSLYNDEEISLFTHERNESQRIEKIKSAFEGLQTAFHEFEENTTLAPTIDECLQQIDEEEAARQNVKSPSL